MKNKMKALTGVLTSLLTLGSQGVIAETDSTTPSGRFKSEYANGDCSHNTKTTIGLAKNGHYDGKSVSTTTQFGESARAYHTESTDCDGKSTHSTSFGARLPLGGFWSSKLKALPFLVRGDTRGDGLETSLSVGKSTVSLTAENRREPTIASRRGAGFDYQATEDLNIGFGRDMLKLQKERWNRI